MSFKPLHTRRLCLRPFTQEDAATVQELAGDREIAATTLLIPHPYPFGAAAQWISSHEEDYEMGSGYHFAITVQQTGCLVGAISLDVNPDHQFCEMGYWVGVPYWNRGYATEAARAVVSFAFSELKLNRIWAHHFKGNDASGRVMQKAGMRLEGVFPQHVRKGGVFIDIHQYGILREDWIIDSSNYHI